MEALQTHNEGMSDDAAQKRAIELLQVVGVPFAERRIEQYPHEFSGGMRQRAMIAMAMANDPSVLIADEPTTALDVTIQAQIVEVLKKAREETHAAIVLITHDLGLIAELADRGRRHVRRTRGRARGRVHDLQRAAASLHGRPDEQPRPPRRGAGVAAADPGPAAEHDRAAARLRLPSRAARSRAAAAVPHGHPELRQIGAGAAHVSAATSRGARRGAGRRRRGRVEEGR
jgi:hypothetical protein